MIETKVRRSYLVLVTEAFGGTGGIAQFNRDFLRAIERSGAVESLVVLPRLGHGVAPPEFPQMQQEVPRFNRVSYAMHAVRTAFVQKSDVVISGHIYHGPLASRIAAMRGARLVSVLHGTEIWSPLKKTHLAPLQKSDLVVCVSEDTRSRYLAQAGRQYMSKALVLHNMVEDRFTPGDRKAARRRIGLNDRKVILTVGRLDNRNGYKGHDRIFPVLARLREQGQEVCYLIAGDGPDRARLEKLVAQKGLTELVTFLGYVPDEALPDLYRAADVFALPSTGEGFGIVFIEAMACGTPAIGLDIGGASAALAGCGQAVSEQDFEESLMAMLQCSSQDPEWRSAAVRSQFGRVAFEDRVKTIADMLTLE